MSRFGKVCLHLPLSQNVQNLIKMHNYLNWMTTCHAVLYENRLKKTPKQTTCFYAFPNMIKLRVKYFNHLKNVPVRI